MSVGKICSRVIATVSPNESVRAAARRMLQNGVGTLVAVEGDRPIGIVTDRDIVTRCVAMGLDPADTPISTIMTKPLQLVSEGTPIEDALARMASAGTRRLIVTTDRGRLAGILALDDVLDLLIEEAEAIGKLLRRQQPALRV